MDLTQLPLASFRRRAIAVTIDLLLVTSSSVLVCWFALGFGAEFQTYLENPRNPVARAKFLEHRDDVRNVATIVYFGYAVFMLLSPWQATIGKRLLGLRVIDQKTRGRVSVLQAFNRAFVFLISSFLGTLGCLAMLWSKTHQTWHDDAAKTFVIDARETEVCHEPLIE